MFAIFQVFKLQSCAKFYYEFAQLNNYEVAQLNNYKVEQSLLQSCPDITKLHRYYKVAQLLQSAEHILSSEYCC